MARKSSKHKHLKGDDGKRRCNRPSAHKRKGTVTRGRKPKGKRRKLTNREILKRKLDRAEKQALERGGVKSQAERDFLENFEAYERARAKKYPQNEYVM